MNSLYLTWKNPDNRQLLIDSLKKGGVCIATTDTVLGLMAACTKEGAENLNKVKKRHDKPFIVLLGTVDDAIKFSDRNISEKNIQLMQRVWPGPVTIIVKAYELLPDFLKGSDGSIALRVPRHDGLQEVAQALGGVFSTSANQTGQPVAVRIEDINEGLLSLVDYIVIDELTTYPDTPSTIVDARTDDIKIIREGAIPAYMISDIVNKV